MTLVLLRPARTSPRQSQSDSNRCRLDEALAAAQCPVKALLITNPDNPHGSVVTPEELERIIAWAFSKDFGVSGLRCGVLVSESEALMAAVNELASPANACPAAFPFAESERAAPQRSSPRSGWRPPQSPVASAALPAPCPSLADSNTRASSGSRATSTCWAAYRKQHPRLLGKSLDYAEACERVAASSIRRMLRYL